MVSCNLDKSQTFGGMLARCAGLDLDTLFVEDKWCPLVSVKYCLHCDPSDFDSLPSPQTVPKLTTWMGKPNQRDYLSVCTHLFICMDLSGKVLLQTVDSTARFPPTKGGWPPLYK